MVLFSLSSGVPTLVVICLLLLTSSNRVATDDCRYVGAAFVSLVMQTQRNSTGHRNIRVAWGSRSSLAGASSPSKLETLHSVHICNAVEVVDLVSTVVVPPVRLERDDYEVFSGLGYYKYHTKPATWNGAYRMCTREGAHLMVINSEAEASIVRQFLSRKYKIEGATFEGYVWSGFHDRGIEGNYITVLGYPLNESGYMKWGPGDPNNVPYGVEPDEDCGAVSKAGLLVDAPCLTNMTFICEQPFV